MRAIKRVEEGCKVQVLEFKDGQAVEIGKVNIANGGDLKSIARAIRKAYPDRNVFAGEAESYKYEYSMSAEDFKKYAIVKEV